MTGLRHDMASIWTMPNASARVTDGRTDVHGVVERGQFLRAGVAGKPHALGHAQFARLRLELRAQRAVADDDGAGIHAGRRPRRHRPLPCLRHGARRKKHGGLASSARMASTRGATAGVRTHAGRDRAHRE